MRLPPWPLKFLWVGLTWYNIAIARDLFGITVAMIIPTLGFFFCCYMRGRDR